MDGKIERELRIDAPPETVYAFLTEPDKMCAWMGVSAEVDPRPGGIYRVNVNGTHVARGEFVEVVSGSRVVFTFGWEHGDFLAPGASTVEFTLSPDAGGTILRMVHSGLQGPEQVEPHVQGWDHYLPRLVVAAAGGDPGPDAMAAAEQERA